MGGGGGNPFQDVSWNRPFGNSFLGNSLQGNPNAPLTSDGKDKQTGQQLVDNEKDPSRGSGSGSSKGLPVEDPQVALQAQEDKRLLDMANADKAASASARQSEADMFTNQMREGRQQQTLAESLQGLQDNARRLRGRTLFR